MTDPKYVASTGIYHVVRHDGHLPFWIEARTFNRAPVVGTEVRVRGFADEEQALKALRIMTRKAIEADSTLSKRFLTSRDGTIASPTSGTQDAPVTRKPRAPKKLKPGPSPKKKDPRKGHRLTTARFVLWPNMSNSIAQVWQCNTDHARRKGGAAGRGAVQLGDVPHLMGSYAVSILIDGTLYFAVDDDGQPQVYPDWMSAERDAVHFWEIAPEPKFDIESQVCYSNGVIEVHLTPKSSTHTPYSLFDTRFNIYLTNLRQSALYGRLDTAIEAANAYRDETATPPSVRIALAFHESDEDRMERELREEAEDAKFARIEAENARLYELDIAERKASRKRREEEWARKGITFMTREQIDAMNAKKVYTTKPTEEQRLRAMRSMQRPRALKDQRGSPDLMDDYDENED